MRGTHLAGAGGEGRGVVVIVSPRALVCCLLCVLLLRPWSALVKHVQLLAPHADLQMGRGAELPNPKHERGGCRMWKMQRPQLCACAARRRVHYITSHDQLLSAHTHTWPSKQRLLTFW